jgi:sugar O-acyltransferase (sialic acid O-acetyltransferase NeuD family)
MKKQLLIYGAGGLGREILSLVKSLDEWEAIGFIDDSQAKGTIVHDIEILGGFSVLQERKSRPHVILAFGDPSVKKRIAIQLRNLNVDFPVLIHPTAVIQDTASVKLGPGTVICSGAVLTTDIILGEHVLINLNSTIGHDCRIGNFSSIMAGVNLAGGVELSEEVLIGSGSNVINRIKIGAGSIVGMGSVVLKNVGSGLTVAGVPSRTLLK